jgi:hypothetical protein
MRSRRHGRPHCWCRVVRPEGGRRCQMASRAPGATSTVMERRRSNGRAFNLCWTETSPKGPAPAAPGATLRGCDHQPRWQPARDAARRGQRRRNLVLHLRTRHAQVTQHHPRPPLCGHPATGDFDLVVEGTAERVIDPAELQTVADGYDALGWPARVAGDALTAELSAPSAGPPPWNVYRVVRSKVYALGTAEP